MDFSTLEELIKIPKKGNASKGKKEEYLLEMSILLNEEGYSASAEKYLISGFSFSSVSPLISLMHGKNSEEKYEIIEKVIRGSLFRKNDNGISFKIAVSLLCQVINKYPEEQKITEKIIGNIPNLSRNKEGNIIGGASKLIEKYFVNELNNNAILPDLSMLEIDLARVVEFCKLFSNLLVNIDPSKKTNINSLNRVKKWVSINTSEASNVKETNKMENIKFIESNKKQLISEDDFSKKPFRFNELLDFAEYLKQAESRITATGLHIKSLEKSLSTIKENLNNTNTRYDRLKREHEVLKDQYNNKILENEKLYGEKVKLDLEFERYRLAYEIKMEEINVLKQEIEKQESVISVFSADKQNAKNEQLNAIASKLKSEYIDYQDAVEMEMTIDLGENLRQQLNTVFKILTKNGINIKGR